MISPRRTKVDLVIQACPGSVIRVAKDEPDVNGPSVNYQDSGAVYKVIGMYLVLLESIVSA